MLKVALVVTYSLPSARSRLGWGVSVLGGTLRGPMSNVGRNGVEPFSCLPEFFCIYFADFLSRLILGIHCSFSSRRKRWAILGQTLKCHLPKVPFCVFLNRFKLCAPKRK
jgi:hypothetical protein